MKKVILLLVCVMLALSLAACKVGDPQSLKITPPNQVVYDAGTDALDLSGGKVGVKYTSGKVRDTVPLDHEDVKLTYSLAVAGDEIPVKVEYKGFEGTFTVQVKAPANIESIEVATRPTKVSYGNSAKVANVEKRGGYLKVNYNDGTSPAIVPFTNPAVSIYQIDHVDSLITVLYKGLTATYTFSYNVNEIAYVTFNQLPDKTTFRSGISQSQARADVDFAGAEAILEIQGKGYGAFKFDNYVKIVSVDLTDKYVTFERQLVEHAEYKNQKVTGTFDIDVTSKWVESFAIKTKPTAEIDAQKGLENYNLAGGTATLTFNDKSTEDIGLDDERFVMQSLSYARSTPEQADINLLYWDNVAYNKVINNAIVGVKVGNHNDVTMFEYYASQLPAVKELVWGATTKVLDADQIKWAKAGFEKYIDFTAAEKAAVGENGIAVYTNYYNHLRYEAYNKSWDKFDQLMEDYRAANTPENKNKLIAQINVIDAANNLYETTFNSEKAKVINEHIVLYSLQEIDVEATATSGTTTYKYVDKNITHDLSLVMNYRAANLTQFTTTDTGRNVISIAEYLLGEFEEVFTITEGVVEGLEDSKAIRELYTKKEAGTATPAELAQANAIESIYEYLAENNEIEYAFSNETQKYEDFVTTKAGTRLDSARAAMYLLTGDDWFPLALDIIYSYYYEPQHRIDWIKVTDTAKTDYVSPTSNKIVKSRATKVEETRYFSIEKEYTIANETAPFKSENRNVEIYLLLIKKVFAPIIEEAVDYYADPLRYFSYGDNLRFLAEYPQYESIMERISEENYTYYSTVEVLYGYRGYADFYQNAIPSMQTDTAVANSVAYKSSTMEDWLWAIGAYYEEVLEFGYGRLISREDKYDNEQFLDFFDDYLEFYIEYTPFVPMTNPYMELTGEKEAAFFADFENIYTKFNALPFEQQGAFALKLDSSYSRFAKQIMDQDNLIDARYATTYYGMMLEAYAAKNLLPDELDIHYDIMNAYVDLSVMAYKGISTERLSSFLANMELFDSKKDHMEVDADGTFKRTEALRLICAGSYESLKTVSSAGLSDIISNLYDTRDFLASYQNTGNDIYGFGFLAYRDELEAAFDEFRGSRPRENALNTLKDYKVGPNANVYTQFMDVVNGYEDEYAKNFKEGTIGYYEKMFSAGKRYVSSIYITGDYADYLTSTTETPTFMNSVKSVFAEHDALIQKSADDGISSSYIYRFWYFTLSVNTLTRMVNDYYTVLNKTPLSSTSTSEAAIKAKAVANAEVVLAKNEVIAYYLYTVAQTLTSPGSRETFGYLPDGKSSENYLKQLENTVPVYLEAAEGIMTLYAALLETSEGDGVSAAIDSVKMFGGMNLTEMKNEIVRFAKELVARGEYDHLISEKYAEMFAA